MEVKQGIRRNFARRAQSYDRHAGMQRRMADQLLEAVGDALGRARRILEIGCGTGYLTHRLRQANGAAQVISLDLDAGLVAAARRRLGPEAGVWFLVADGEKPVGGEFDLIIANSTFQWFTQPEKTLAEYYRSLAPGGILAFSTLGPGTFQELVGALGQAARGLELPAPPVIPAQRFGDRETWSDLLIRAGFLRVRLSREIVTATYPSVMDFLRALQATGATNPRPRPFSPRMLSALIAAYQAGYGWDGVIPVSYEMIWAVAEK
ncbi:MAG TPA: methyltransferase domain-containing protein [Desulfobaccales bacterium]|nr:methyltransferase domain-containing protein [Desulfobaccales bacterium]